MRWRPVSPAAARDRNRGRAALDGHALDGHVREAGGSERAGSGSDFTVGVAAADGVRGRSAVALAIVRYAELDPGAQLVVGEKRRLGEIEGAEIADPHVPEVVVRVAAGAGAEHDACVRGRRPALPDTTGLVGIELQPLDRDVLDGVVGGAPAETRRR